VIFDTILRRMPDYMNYNVPQFARTHISFRRVPIARLPQRTLRTTSWLGRRAEIPWEGLCAGRRAVSASADQTLKVWALESGREPRTLWHSSARRTTTTASTLRAA
jgi:hypothetical protein